MSEDVAPEVLRAMITRNTSDNAASAAFLNYLSFAVVHFLLFRNGGRQ